jgi:Lrp/AsnC family leucine-responsive transcriptional regulator
MKWARSTPEVQEFHIIAGEYDYLLKIRCRDSGHLERLLRKDVRAVAGVLRTNSTIVMATKKETSAVPLKDAEPE